LTIFMDKIIKRQSISKQTTFFETIHINGK
jgi:hypothetical protein